MPRERFNHAIVEELEEELRQALEIEPSPDFVRRVRARIEQQRKTAAVSFSGTALAMVASLCLIAVGLERVAMREDVGWVGAKMNVVRTGSDVDLVADTIPAAPAAVIPRYKPRSPEGRRALAPPGQEVIVPPDAARALARLLELARSGAVDEETLRPVAASSAPGGLAVAPLVVPAIPVPEIDIKAAAARRGATRE